MELIIGGDATISTFALVNTTIASTCFACLNSKNLLTITPTFSINDVVIPLNTNVNQVQYILVVTNFSSLPLLLDGVDNQFECVDADGSYFSRTVTTISKE